MLGVGNKSIKKCCPVLHRQHFSLNPYLPKERLRILHAKRIGLLEPWLKSAAQFYFCGYEDSSKRSKNRSERYFPAITFVA
jgi:hypothetical protein